MTINHIPGLAAIVCFAVATLSAVGAFDTNVTAWIAGGLLALTIAVLAPRSG